MNDSLVFSYLSCFLRFDGESNDEAIDRFFLEYDYNIDYGSYAGFAELIEEQAHSGVALTQRMLREMTNINVDLAGLSPNAVTMFHQKLVEERRRQSVKSVGHRLLAAASGNSDENVAMILNDLNIEDEQRESFMSLPTHSAVGMKLYAERAEEIASGKVRVAFPWYQVNEAVPFIYDDDLILLTGKSKHGKSSAAHQIALYNASRMNVLYFHNEDNVMKMFLRRIAQYQLARDPSPLASGGPSVVGTLDYHELVSSSLKSQQFLDKIEQESAFVMQKLGERLTYVYCAGWTAEQIIAEWSRFRRKHPLGLVIIDYLNKIESYGKAKILGSMAGAMEYNVELFKREAGRKNAMCPCLLIQQENEDGTVRDTRSSYIKSQIHLSVERDVNEARILTSGHVRVLRANDGRTGSFMAVFYPPYMVWLT